MTRLTAFETLDAVLVPTSYLRYGAREVPQWEAQLARHRQPPFSKTEKLGLGAVAVGLEIARLGLYAYAFVTPFLE